MSGKNYAKYMVKGSTLALMSSTLAGIASFLLRVFLARSLSVTDYGLFFAIFSFISFFTVFRHLGLDQAMTKYVSEYKAKKSLKKIESTLSTVLSVKTILTIWVALILIGLSGWLSTSFFNNPSARVPFLILVAWFSVYYLIRYFKKIFQGFQDILGHSLSGDLPRLLFTSVALGGFLLLGFFNLTSAAISYLLGVIFASLLSFFLLRKRHPELFLLKRRAISKSTARKLLSFGLPLVLSGIAMTFMNQLDTVMLTAFRSMKVVGLYQVARPTTKILTSFGGAIGIPLLPMISEFWAKKDKEKLRYTLRILSKFSLILITPAILVFLAYPTTIIKILFGSDYLGGATALQILSVSTAFMLGSSIFGSVIAGTGHPRLRLKVTGVAVIFNIFANYILIPPYGAGGAAIVTSFSFLIALILDFHFTRKIIKFPVPISAIVKTLIGSGLTLGIIWGLNQIVFLPLWPTLFAVLVPSFLFYTVWELQTGAVTEQDLTLIQKTTPIPNYLIRLLKRLAVK